MPREPANKLAPTSRLGVGELSERTGLSRHQVYRILRRHGLRRWVYVSQAKRLDDGEFWLSMLDVEALRIRG